MKMICIMCPMGCELTVTKNGNNISVTGNNCIRGERYAVDELNCPKRVVTSLIRVGKGVLPVKTSAPVPKNKVNEVINEIAKTCLKSANLGDIAIKNVLNLGVDVIVTGNKVKFD